MSGYKEIIDWLLKGDVAIRYQTQHDLLGSLKPSLQKRIHQEGWGKVYLDKRRADGHWGLRFYQPKWTSSHYTLLDLRNLQIIPDHPEIRDSIQMIAKNEKGQDGGINPSGTINNSDVCINGMFLNYASYFKIDEYLLHTVVDFILSQKMSDGGFNCRLNRSGAHHSSMHTTICTLEGIASYRQNGYSYRMDELTEVETSSREFLLTHHLFKSDRTGKVIHKDFVKMPYPSRWRYDFLRALDYFQYANVKWDNRLQDALDLLVQKRMKDGRWKLNAHHTGKTHLIMETAGKPSRWNTLRALRVLDHFEDTHR